MSLDGYESGGEWGGFVSEHALPASPLSSPRLQATLAGVEICTIPDHKIVRLDPQGTCCICLEPYESPAMADPCFHIFCFQCILQWLLVTPSCPLCKANAVSVIHDIRSDKDYKQILLSGKDGNGVASTLEGSSETAFFTRAHEIRRSVYTRRLKPRPLLSTLFKSMADLPSILRSSPVALERLKPWVRRELQAILRVEDVEVILSVVIAVISRGVTSPQARDSLRDYLFEDTETFLMELEIFARSPYSIDQYDRLAVYDDEDTGRMVSVSAPSNFVRPVRSAIPVSLVAQTGEPSRQKRDSRSGSDTTQNDPVPTTASEIEEMERELVTVKGKLEELQAKRRKKGT